MLPALLFYANQAHQGERAVLKPSLAMAIGIDHPWPRDPMIIKVITRKLDVSKCKVKENFIISLPDMLEPPCFLAQKEPVENHGFNKGV